jgi:hypothetical protein
MEGKETAAPGMPDGCKNITKHKVQGLIEKNQRIEKLNCKKNR